MSRVSRVKPTPEMKAGRLARKAAERIRKFGWTKGTHGDEKRGMCVRAAFAHAYGMTTERWSTSEGPVAESCTLFGEWLCAQEPILGDRGWHANGWNDGAMSDEDFYKFPSPKNAEEVISVLNKFADEVDPQGGPRSVVKRNEMDPQGGPK